MLRLGAHVPPRVLELTDAHRPQIVAIGPAQARARHQAVTIRYPRARTLQTLHQAGNVDHWWELQDDMDVIGYDTQLEYAGAVPHGLLSDKPFEEASDVRIQER